MASTLTGKRIAFLATDGVEQVELTEPWKAVQEAGGQPELVSPKRDRILGLNHLDHGDTFTVDTPVKNADPADYDGLVLPGGVANADFLRMEKDAMAFVQRFFEQGKPVGVICHAPWALVETGIVKGRTLTSWPSLKTDIENAGGTWVDEELCVDRGLFTSRKPDDLPAFCAKLVEEFAEGEHEEQREATRAAVG
jgi:protease I